MGRPTLKSRTSADRPAPILTQPSPIPESVPDPLPIPAPPVIPPPPVIPEFEDDESGSQEAIEIIDEEIVSGPETFVVLVDDEEEAEIEAVAKETPPPAKPVSRNPFMRSMSIGPPRMKL